MIVVSDTTPLNYLLLINLVDILPRIFDGVLAPESVLRELSAPKAPEVVRRWAHHPPAWLQIEKPTARLPSTRALDDGEADAISLAKERGILEILIDEKMGRRIAIAEGLVTIPTIALLEKGDFAGLLEFGNAIKDLRETTFHAPEAKIEEARQRIAMRKRGQR